MRCGAAQAATFSYTGSATPIPPAIVNSGSAQALPGASAKAPITVSGLSGVVTSVTVTIGGTDCTTQIGVGIEHTYSSDLRISLQAPNGKEVGLIRHVGEFGRNFCQVALKDGEAQSIQGVRSSQAPYTGTYSPNSPLAAMDGQVPNGEWALVAQDFYVGDDGNIRAWSIDILTDALPLPIAAVNILAVGDTQVTVGWTPPADSGSPITKYTVTGMPGGTCTSEIVAPATEPEPTCTVTGLTNGVPHQFTVVATNANGDSAVSPLSTSATPSTDLRFVGAAPVIALPAGAVGASYSQTVSVVGGLPPYTFVLAGELPAGLDFDTAKGMLFGTPTAPGSYSFTITASDYTLATGPTLKAMPSHQAVQKFTLQVASAAVKAPTPVPTMGAWGGLLLSGLVLGLAGFTRRKKSAIASA